MGNKLTQVDVQNEVAVRSHSNKFGVAFYSFQFELTKMRRINRAYESSYIFLAWKISWTSDPGDKVFAQKFERIGAYHKLLSSSCILRLPCSL